MVATGKVSAAAVQVRARGSLEEALRRAETSLKEAREEEQAILDTAVFGIAILKDRTIQRCNRRFAEMFGYTEEELIGRSSRMFFASDEEFVGFEVRANRAMAELGSYQEERVSRRKDRTDLWCHFAGRLLDRTHPDRGTLWVAEDIAEQKRAEAQLRRSEERLALAFRASDSGIWDWELGTDETFYSARFRELLGYATLSNERFRAAYDLRDRLPAEDRERTLTAMQRALESLEPFNEVCRLRCADGSYRWFHVRGQALGGEGGRAKRMAGSITDVTEARAREEALARTRSELAAAHDWLSDAIESIPDAFALFDADDRLVMCNQIYAEVFAGATNAAAVMGRSFEELVRELIARGEAIPPEYSGDVEAWVAERVRRHRNQSEEGMTYQLGDGRWYQVRERRTRDGGIVGVRTDVTELKAGEERIQHLANHDPLTGLPNRRLLQDRMEQSLLLARRKGALVGVMVVDLDRFKVINDTAGHLVGDEVMRAVASRLRASVREADTVARHGGDEFVVLLPELRETQDAHKVAEKMIAGVSAPIEVAGRQYQVGASVGIAVYPDDAQDGEALLHCADEAMYAAKEGGGNRARRRGP